ncbi:hypothetical protein E2C01_075223 [Portunus trituberculatus]|uniref:Uncharacterized protein n=1 Tax=Portunus trituberculatus TaxID=210409 RepID=A0A5B7IIL0_PORTR|nr:hypothetical protein [Portunus trituberculatus]
MLCAAAGLAACVVAGQTGATTGAASPPTDQQRWEQCQPERQRHIQPVCTCRPGQSTAGHGEGAAGGPRAATNFAEIMP